MNQSYHNENLNSVDIENMRRKSREEMNTLWCQQHEEYIKTHILLSKWITKRNQQAGSYRKVKSKLKPPKHHKTSFVPLVKETKLFLSSAAPAWAKDLYNKKTNWEDYKIPKIE